MIPVVVMRPSTASDTRDSLPTGRTVFMATSHAENLGLPAGNGWVDKDSSAAPSLLAYVSPSLNGGQLWRCKKSGGSWSGWTQIV